MAAPAPAPPSQEVLIAQAFTAQYAAALAGGNAAGLTAFYGPDSVASYDGNTQTGATAIAAAFITPRLAGGPVNVRWSSVDAQFTPTQQLLIVATGECDKPAGRFTQAFVLAPTAGGGMYIRAEVVRFGPGAAPQNTALDKTGMGSGIAQQYYGLYQSNRAGLQGLYRANSQLAFETKPVATGAAIASRLTDEMPGGAHAMQSIDALQFVEAPGQPIAAAVLLVVTGAFTITGEANPLAFQQTFVLIGEAAGAYCSNEVFRFNYA